MLINKEVYMWNFAQETAVPVLYTDTSLSSTEETGLMAFLVAYWLVGLVLWVLSIVALWKVFEKAEEPGWKAIIPFYNWYVLFQIAGRNGLWFLALFIPVVGLVVSIMLALDLAKHFGKSTMFGIFGLWVFSIIGLFILGYGDTKYVGTKHE
jgi:hypothetical protein